MADSTPHKNRDQHTEPARSAEEREHAQLWRWIKRASDWIKAKSKKHGDEAEWALGRRTARVLEGVALFAVAVALLLVFLDWFIAPTEAKERQGLALVLAISFGGIAAFVGLYLTGQQLRITRELEEDRARDAALRACLEQLRRLLTHDKWSTNDQASDTDKGTTQAGGTDKGATDDTLRYLAQAEALSVLGTLDGPRKRILVRFLYESRLLMLKATPEVKLTGGDLRKADLSQLNLTDVSLSGVRLGSADLSRATLIRADLSDSDLSEANLVQAKLVSANLRNAFLGEANLRGPDLNGADLTAAVLSEAKLGGINLSRADLSNAWLDNVDMSEPDLKDVDTNVTEEQRQEARRSGELRTNLSGAILTRAMLSEASLPKADLSQANLSRANLSRANLSQANLSQAKLSQANLSYTQHLTQEQLKEATGNRLTKLPSDLMRPTHWA